MAITVRSIIGIGLLLLLSDAVALAAPATAPSSPPTPAKAVIKTSMGNIEVLLAVAKTPQAVSNFVSLAKKGFYNGQVFFRVVPGFLIQAGAPDGTNAGDPGYDIEKDTAHKLKHDKPGIIAFVAGESGYIHGSQFVITLRAAPHLDRRQQIFGEVVSGLEVVQKISETPTRAAKPIKDVKINSIEITPADIALTNVKTHRLLQPQDIQQLTVTQANLLAQKFGEAQKLGALQKLTLVATAANGGKIQANYAAEFAERRTAKVIVYGRLDRKEEFRLQESQFMLD